MDLPSWGIGRCSTSGDSGQLTRSDHHVAVVELGRQLARQDDERIAGVLMAVPDESLLTTLI